MSQDGWQEPTVVDVRFNFTQMYTHSQTNLSVKKQSDIPGPSAHPWRRLKISFHSIKVTPWREQERERLASRMTALLKHFIFNDFLRAHLNCRLLHIKSSSQLWRKKEFLLPWFSLAYGWRWGRNLPTSHTDCLWMYRSCAFPLLDEQLIFYSAFYASLGRLFFFHLKIFLGRNMLPSAMPLCCNYILWSQTVRQHVVPQ